MDGLPQIWVWRFRPSPELERLWGERSAALEAEGVSTSLELGDAVTAEERWPRGRPEAYPLAPGLKALCAEDPALFDVVVRASRPVGERDKRLPVIETERVRLRALRHADAPRLHEALSDEATMRYWSRGPVSSLEETRGYVAWNVEADASNCWAITEKSAGPEALGWMIIIDRRAGVGEVGYILSPRGRGRGLAREAAKTLLGHPLAGGRYRRLCADVDPDNRASIDLLEHAGFTLEGRLRGEWETHIGVRDSLIFGRYSVSK